MKVKSLAAEARIIRLEERKALGRRVPDAAVYASLRTHRVCAVRREQRSSLLAYGFLRGRPYAAIETPAATNPPDWARVKKIASRFNGHWLDTDKSALDAWAAGPPASPLTAEV